jgi:S-adenosylmethionine hydrolase
MIAIFTDFGVSGPYLGQMRAAVHTCAPGVDVVDLFPDLPVYNVRASAFLLPAYVQFLPAGTVCLCVVDPGVGTDRKALALQVDDRWFVGPDNGLFSMLIRRARKVEAYEIHWRPEHLSDSFHGRDLFAPIAAKLEKCDVTGLEQIETSELTMPHWPDDLPEVVYTDHYGNLVTGLRAGAISKTDVLEIQGQRCCYCRTFAEAGAGLLFWYENSNGLVEIALNQGDAAAASGMRIGSLIRIPG